MFLWILSTLFYSRHKVADKGTSAGEEGGTIINIRSIIHCPRTVVIDCCAQNTGVPVTLQYTLPNQIF